MKVENLYEITTEWNERFFCECFSMHGVLEECERRGLDPTQYRVQKVA